MVALYFSKVRHEETEKTPTNQLEKKHEEA